MLLSAGKQISVEGRAFNYGLRKNLLQPRTATSAVFVEASHGICSGRGEHPVKCWLGIAQRFALLFALSTYERIGRSLFFTLRFSFCRSKFFSSVHAHAAELAPGNLCVDSTKYGKNLRVP